MRPDAESTLLAALRQRRPKVVVKADLLPAISVLSFVALVGVPVAWIWSRLAPPTQFVVSAHGLLPLPQESLHGFDGVAIQSCLGLATGAVIGVVVWLLRGRRGPVVMLGAVLGALLAGWLAHALGDTFAGALYPAPTSTSTGQLVLRAPRSGTLLGLLCWGLGTALAYGVLAVWNGRHDLGRRLG